MNRLRLFIINSLFVLSVYLVFVIAVLIVVEMQPVSADTLAHPVADITTTTDASVLYQPLTNAVPQRSIMHQQFAPPAPTHR